MAEKICNIAVCPPEMHELKELELDRGPVPTQSIWRENFFILSRGLPPLLLQAASYYFFPGEFRDCSTARNRTATDSLGDRRLQMARLSRLPHLLVRLHGLCHRCRRSIEL